MNNNERSLISHALKLYGMQYNDNIELRYYSNLIIEVCERNIQNSYMLRVYNEMIRISIYKSRNTPSKLNNNIRSFINHWMQYCNFNEKINRVAVSKCLCDTFNIVILYDNRWYRVLVSPHNLAGDWIVYKW